MFVREEHAVAMERNTNRAQARHTFKDVQLVYAFVCLKSYFFRHLPAIGFLQQFNNTHGKWGISGEHVRYVTWILGDAKKPHKKWRKVKSGILSKKFEVQTWHTCKLVPATLSRKLFLMLAKERPSDARNRPHLSKFTRDTRWEAPYLWEEKEWERESRERAEREVVCKKAVTTKNTWSSCECSSLGQGGKVNFARSHVQ